ncbi:MAG TPA: nucleoside-diphosphate-sugar pyrophosphorylase [Desulfobacteraceae bacterium]|nr:nucleoside-diphosphate-sugar pyrophosphorylase [Desulfobacteraceae bacterium]
MKALVLAAGFGTRLAPYTRILPKPLFTLNARPVLDLAIERLLACGCTKIFINTHHLAQQIQDHVSAHPHRETLETVYEPEILDTGGAVANLRAHLEDDDFFVVNADIVCDLDLSQLMQIHKGSNAAATLAVHNDIRFNKLKVVQETDGTARVAHFKEPAETGMTFTGIQAVSPAIFDHMPDTPIFSSIDVYKRLCPEGRIHAFVPEDIYWQDIGTPDSYRSTSRKFLAGRIFKCPPSEFKSVKIARIAGDGSDRNWFRASAPEDDGEQRSIVISDHGICLKDTAAAADPKSTQPDPLAQIQAFTAIGSHLRQRQVAVPEVLGYDTLSGQVALADLGHTHLADAVKKRSQSNDNSGIKTLYQQVIDALIIFSREGHRGFNPDWTCQTRSYSKPLILDLECRYFINAFARGYMEADAPWETYAAAFEHIADNALAYGFTGLMHRDCQSKNIMLKAGRPWFIDFQSARTGPLQYDLASLLIDPYVTLPDSIQADLLDYAVERLGLSGKKAAQFCHSYTYCGLTRNLQMLGAFGFLTRVKDKPAFASYIPAALKDLHLRLNSLDEAPLAVLNHLVENLLHRLPARHMTQI